MTDGIREAVISHLETLDIGMPYRFENVSSSTSSDAGYAEVFLHRFPTTRPTLEAGFMSSGFLQVSLLGKQGVGAVAMDAKAQLIRDHFPADLKLPVADPIIRVVRTPDIGDGFPDGPSWHVPVTIYYETWG